MSNRVTRGFGRIGVGAAVLVALCGIGCTIFMAAEDYSQAHWAANGDWRFGTPVPTLRGFNPDKPYDYEFKGRLWHHDPSTNSNSPLFSPVGIGAKTAGIGLGITALLSAAAWGFFAGLGWVAAGFARD